MKRKSTWVAALFLGLPMGLRADPIAPFGPLDMSASRGIWGSLFLEVLVVLFLIRHCRLRPVVFCALWFLINLFTFYVLLPGAFIFSSLLLSAVLPESKLSESWYYLGAEVTVFLVEALILYGYSRVNQFRTAVGKPVSLRLALAASLAGNLTSVGAYYLLGVYAPSSEYIIPHH